MSSWQTRHEIQKRNGNSEEGFTYWLWVLLSWVIAHALWISQMCLLVHGGGRNGRAAVLLVGRVPWHLALWLESGRHAASHLLRQRAVRLWRVIGHVWVVVLGWETTAASSLWGISPIHVVAHVAVPGLRRLAAQVLRLRERAGLRGHGNGARLCAG